MSDLYSKASLVMNPQLVDTGKVYSIKPEDRKGDFTFTRSSAATRVNADGLVEKETQNLLYQSNNFNSGFWSTSATSVTSGQSGYDGTNDAWLLSKSASSARIQQSISTSGVQTYSVYVKAGTLNYVMLNNSVVSQWFDLSNGTIGTNSSSTNTIDASIESVGNGWYRCSLIFNSSISIVRIYPSQADNDVSGTSGNIYIQDAQLEQGLVARDYIETTTPVEGGITDNVPRLDYTDSSCPALLLEPQRFNAIDSSEYAGAWSAIDSNITITNNAATSPEGVDNAVKLEGLTGSGGNQIVNFGALILNGVNIVGKTYTASVYIKPVNPSDVGDDITLSIQRNSGDFEGLNLIVEITSADWKRYDLTYTFTGAGAGNQVGANFKILRTNTTIDDIYIWGVQLEEGSYATSYIPTYGTSVTRNGDDMYNISSIYGGDSQTIFLDLNYDDYDNSNFWTSLQIGTSLNDWFFFGKYQNSIRTYIKSNNSISYDNTHYVGFSEPQRIKLLLKYDSSGAKTFLNGSLIIDQTYSGTISIPAFDRLTIQINYGSPTLIKTQVNQVLVFPTALTDQEAINLTTI